MKADFLSVNQIITYHPRKFFFFAGLFTNGFAAGFFAVVFFETVFFVAIYSHLLFSLKRKRRFLHFSNSLGRSLYIVKYFNLFVKRLFLSSATWSCAT